MDRFWAALHVLIGPSCIGHVSRITSSHYRIVLSGAFYVFLRGGWYGVRHEAALPIVLSGGVLMTQHLFLSMCHFGPVGETEAHVLSRVILAPSIDRRCRKPADEYDRCTSS